MSISRDEDALEASSASAPSKNRLRGFVEGKERMSTRRSLAACLATAFEVQITDMTSNFRLKRLRLRSNSRGVFGKKSTLLMRSILTLLHMFFTVKRSSRIHKFYSRYYVFLRLFSLFVKSILHGLSRGNSRQLPHDLDMA